MVLIVFTVDDLLQIIYVKRYLDNDNLTNEQEEKLRKTKGIIIEEYGNNQRTYTFSYNYK